MSIRLAKPTDIPRILEIYAPYVENTTFSFEYNVPSPESFALRFETITAQFPWLVWEEAGAVMGYAYASAPFERAAYSWCAEPSIYLAPEIHGKGVGRKLYLALEALLQLQGYRVSYAIITSENKPSVDFHAALGYTHLATFPNCGFKHGRWLGTIWMEKVLNLVESPNNMPVSFFSIVNNDRKLSEILAKMRLS